MLQGTGSVGQVLGGRYRLVALIGRGGMGSVWRADHLSLGTPVAIKLVHPDVAQRPGMVARFLREAQAASMVRSTNVVHVVDHGVDGGTPYIAMEYLEGETLARRLDRGRRLGAAATAAIMAGVCRALARAHRMGVVHRDLKPDNIFIARDEAGSVVKVLDFGIAKVLDRRLVDPTAPTEATSTPNRTETGAVLGTPRYMSPEQTRGRATIDGRSDLWSLAVIAFECLTGRVPFDAQVPGELVMQICSEPVPRPSSVAEVPEGFDAWFERATQRDPDARFQTVRELADALADVLAPGQRWLEGPSGEDSEAGRGAAASRPDPAGLESTTGSQATSSEAPPISLARRRWLGLGAVAMGALVIAAAIRWTAPRPPTEAPASLASASPQAVPRRDPPPRASAMGPRSAPSPRPAPRPVDSADRVLATAPPASASALPPASAAVDPAAAPRRVTLAVVPADAAVEVDGQRAEAHGGVVEIRGALGSRHHARISKGDAAAEQDVFVTEAGAIPPRIELKLLPPRPPKPARPAHAAHPVNEDDDDDLPPRTGFD